MDSLTSTPGVQAEYDPPRLILMHQPRQELLMGLVHPLGAYFEQSFDRYAAIREHADYVKALEKEGAKVLRVSDVALERTATNPVDAVRLEELRDLAVRSIRVTGHVDACYKEAYVEKAIASLHPEDLLDIALLRPHVELRNRQQGGGVEVETYQCEPVPNLYFLRDQLLTTDKGVVLGRMARSIRAPELDIIKFVLRRLEIEPIYQVEANDTCEGGDFIPCGKVAFIGQGARTTPGAIEQLLQNKVFGYDEVVVVKDKKQDESQMHLDTYFNVIGKDLVLLAQVRHLGHLQQAGYEDWHLTADVYRRSGDSYQPVPGSKDLDFVTYVQEQGFKLVIVTEPEQLQYGVNVLCMGDRKAIGSELDAEEMTRAYARRLTRYKVRLSLMDFANIKLGYGSNHCMTQVLKRL